MLSSWHSSARWRAAGLILFAGAVSAFVLSAVLASPGAQPAAAAPAPSATSSGPTAHPPAASGLPQPTGSGPAAGGGGPGRGGGGGNGLGGGTGTGGQPGGGSSAGGPSTGGSPGGGRPGSGAAGQPVTVRIPPALVGAGDGLPAVLPSRWTGRTLIAIWVAAGIRGARVTVTARGSGVRVTGCTDLPVTPGRISILACPVSVPASAGGHSGPFTITVTVTSGREVLASRSFRHG